MMFARARWRWRSARLARSLAGVCVGLLLACSSDAGLPEVDADIPRWSVSGDVVAGVGVTDGSPEYTLSRVAAVRLLPDGGIAVADGQSASIRIYAADGTFVRQWGRPGQGPGEFGWINGMILSEPDTLMVYDAEQARLTSFTTEGERLPEMVTFRADDGRVEIYLGRLRDGSHAGAWIRQTPRPEDEVSPDLMRIARFGPDGAFQGVLADDVGMRRLRGPTPFSPHFLGTVLDDRVYHTDGLEPVIPVTTAAGEPAPPLSLPLEPMETEAAWSSLEAALDSATAARLGEFPDLPVMDSVPVISHLLSDRRGRLWMKRYEPASDSHWLLRSRSGGGGSWLVMEPGGDVVALVSMPDGFQLMEVRGDRVAGVSRDELGVERVEVRRLDRGPDPDPDRR